MRSMAGGGEIEFIDTARVPVDRPDETMVVDRSPLRWLAPMALLLICGWFLTSTGPDVTPSADEAPIPERAQAPAVDPPDFGTWPSPRDRDPKVKRVVGPALPPPEFSAVSLRSTSLVYVGVSGLPIVVSLDTGDVSSVEVAPVRIHDTFAVEAGQVVAGHVAAESETGDRPFVFHTYRDVDRPGVGTMSDLRGVGLGPELCLSGETCARPGSGVDRRQQGGFVAERFDPSQHPVLAEVLDGWDLVDGMLVSPDGYEIPEPVGLIWVISPISGGSVSSSGLL